MKGAFVAGPVQAERMPFLELSQDAWERMIGEVRKAFLAARDYAREQESPGRIVFISAAAAARPIAGATLEGVAGAYVGELAGKPGMDRHALSGVQGRPG